MPPKKSNLPQNESVQSSKREAVLKEAGRAFSKRGFHNTSLQDVADALHVSKGTLYNYVRDKQDILHEFQRIGTEIGVRAFQIGEGMGGTGAQRLRNTLSTYIRLLTEELGAANALTELDAMRPEDRAKAIQSRDGFQRRYLKLMKSGMKDGSLREISDPKLAIYTIMGAINWLPRWYAPEGRLSGAELGETMADLLLEGLVTEGA